MPSLPVVGRVPDRSVILALLAVCCGVFTAWEVARGRQPVRLVLLASLTVYLFGAALPPVRRLIPEYEQVAAVPLGVLGVVASVQGAPTDLPVLFVLLGVGGLVELAWSPTRDGRGDRSD